MKAYLTIAVVVASLALAIPARATVWTYEQESLTCVYPPCPFPITVAATITLADGTTFADMPTLSSRSPGPYNFGNLEALRVKWGNVPGLDLATLAAFTPTCTNPVILPGPVASCLLGFPDWRIGPGGIRFIDQGDNFEFNISVAPDDTAAIFAAADAGGCADNCLTTGIFVEAPEPTSLWLFVVGLLLLGANRAVPVITRLKRAVPPSDRKAHRRARQLSAGLRVPD
jgi:hypothetical protein